MLSAALLLAPALAAEQRFITIGTGGVTGVYYSVGGAICQLVNKNRRSHGLRCSVEATAASVYNLQSVRKGELDLGLAQSGMHHAAYHGIDVFRRDGANKNLRSLFSLHYEVVTVVARKDAGVRRFEDFLGKRFNIGVVGAGTRVGAEKLIEGMGMKEADFARLTELKPDEMVEALCKRDIDGYVYMVGHPAQNITEATTRCASAIVPLAGPKIDKLLRDYPYYVRATVPGGMYPGNPDTIPTYAVRGTLVTQADADAGMVYQIVKAVFDNFDEFVSLHPALAGLDAKTLIKDGLTAPLHDGAIRYYRERGWL
jgi:TRAP transporter TAXI family solute receptor